MMNIVSADNFRKAATANTTSVLSPVSSQPHALYVQKKGGGGLATNNLTTK